MISQWKRATGIGHCADYGGQPDQNNRPSRNRHEVRAHEHSSRKYDEHSPPHFFWRDDPGLSHSRRADAFLGISTTNKVVVVVCEIGTDLNQYRPY